MPKYRIIPYDIVNDIWILQERFLFIFWKWIGTGRKHEVESALNGLLYNDQTKP